MKKFILTNFTIILICFTSCDEIEAPYKNLCLDPLACNLDGLLPCIYPEFGVDCDSLNILENSKTILVEKFTGHKCSNCPEATRKLKELQQLYGNNIIPVAIHPGSLIEFTGTDSNYPYNFTTSPSDIIANDMGAIYLPLGTINRIPGGNSNRCFTKENWGSEIHKLLYDSEGNPLARSFNIEINTSFNETNKELTIETDIESLDDVIENYKFALILIEDSIIAPQIDGTEYIENYEHNHIYRCAINGTYGESINLESNVTLTTTHTMIFNTDYNSNWTVDWNNISNCYVVAYIYNDESLIIEESRKKQIINE